MGAPSGTVTFLFTDIEGSTRLWDTAPGDMRAALEGHDAIVRGAIEVHRGYVFATGGDGFAAAFASPIDAVAAAGAAQAALGLESWPEAAMLRVRMGLHTGVVDERGGDYFGPAVNTAARLMGIGHGGQVLCTAVTAELLGGTQLVDLGEHRLRDLSAPQRVFQVGEGRFRPLRSLDATPGNLPLQHSSFIGRDEEIAAVAGALSAARLVTLVGPGGVGKTRLALHVAAEGSVWYPDGAWLCELAAAGADDDVAQVVGVALGVRSGTEAAFEDSVVSSLRYKRLLLVLDNCEHVPTPPAGSAGGCWPVARTCGSWPRAKRCWRLRGSTCGPSGPWTSPRRAPPPTSSPPAPVCACSLTGPTRRARTSSSMTPIAAPSRRSAVASTGSRWRSSSPRRA